MGSTCTARNQNSGAFVPKIFKTPGLTARKRAEHTSRLVGAATQTECLPLSGSLQLKVIEDIIVSPNYVVNPVVAVAATAGGNGVVGRPRLLRSATMHPDDVTLLRRPPPLQSTKRGAVTQPPDPSVEPLRAGPVYDTPIPSAAPASRPKPSAAVPPKRPRTLTSISPTELAHIKSNGCGIGTAPPSPPLLHQHQSTFSGEPKAGSRAPPNTRTVRGHAVDPGGCAEVGNLLMELARDADLLYDSQGVCLAALDRLTRAATTITVAPQQGLTSRQCAHAGFDALLHALRCHCRGCDGSVGSQPLPPLAAAPPRTAPPVPPSPPVMLRFSNGEPTAVAATSLSPQQLLHVSRQLVRLRVKTDSSGGDGAGAGGSRSSGGSGDGGGGANLGTPAIQGTPAAGAASTSATLMPLCALLEELAAAAAGLLEVAAASAVWDDPHSLRPCAAAAAAVAAARCGATILHNLVKLGFCGGEGVRLLAEAVAAAAVRHPQVMVPSLDAQALQNLIWALGKLDERIHELQVVQQLVAALAARLAEPGLLDGMSPVGLSMVVYGMGKVGMPYTDVDVRKAVAAAVAAAAAAAVSVSLPGSVLPSGAAEAARVCGPQALANMAWGLSRTTPPVKRADALESSPELAACVQLAAAAVRQLDSFKPREAANLIGGLAALGVLTDPRIAPLLEACRGYLRVRQGELGPQDLAEVLYAFAVAAATVADAEAAMAAPAELPPHELRGGLLRMGRPMVRDAAFSSAACSRRQAVHPFSATAGSGGSGSGVDGSEAQKRVAARAVQDPELWALLERRCLQILPYSPPYQVVTMLWAFAHLQHRPAGLLAPVLASFAPPPPGRDTRTDVRMAVAEGRADKQRPVASEGVSERGSGAEQQQQQESTGLHPHHHRKGRGQPGARATLQVGFQQQQQHNNHQQRVSGLRPQSDPDLNLDFDVGSLPSTQLSRLVWALARLCARVPAAGLQRLCDGLHGRIAEFDAQSLLLLTWGLASLGCPGEAALELVVGRLAALLPSLAPNQLPMALWAVAKLMVGGGGAAPAAPPPVARAPLPDMSVLRFFQDSRGALAAALPRLSPRGVAMAAWAYAAAGVNPGDSALAALWEHAGRVAAAAGYGSGGGADQALAMMVDAMAEFRCRHGRLTRAVLAAAATRMAAMPPSLPPLQPLGNAATAAAEGVWLSSIVCSFGRLGLYDYRVLELACRRAARLAPLLTPREAIPLLWGLGAMAKRGGGGRAEGGRSVDGRQGADDGLPGAVAALTEVIERAVLDGAAAATAAATSSSRRPPRRSCRDEATAPAAAAPPDGFDGRMLSIFLIACVALRHRPPAAVLEAVSALLCPRLPSLASHTLCEVAWALAVLRPPPAGGGDIGVYATLPLPPVPQPPMPTAEAAAAAAAALYSVPEFRPQQRAGAKAGGGRSSDRGGRRVSGDEGASMEACAAGEEGSPSPTKSFGTAPGFHVDATGSGNEGRGRGADRDSGKGANARLGGSSGVGAGVDGTPHVIQRRPRWPLRWDPPEVPLVLTVLRHRLRLLPPRGRNSRPALTQLAAVSARKSDPRVGAAPGRSDRGGKTSDGDDAAAAVVAAAAPPPLTPLASVIAPIYPPRAAVPTQMAASQHLLGVCLRLLAGRLCVERSELLTLESLVKITWAMCVLRMYTPRLFRYCAARSMCCSTASLERRPPLLRALIQIRALIARQRPSTWRRLRLRNRWRRRLAAAAGFGGATWSVSPADVMAAAPLAEARRLQRCRASLEAAAEAAGLFLEWRNTYEGDRHGVLRLGNSGRARACALLVVPPWEEPETPAAAEPPLAGAAVAARLLLLRGWLVAAVRVDDWLALAPEEQRRQLAALHAQMRAAAAARAQRAMMAIAAAEAGAEGAAAGDGGARLAAETGFTAVAAGRRSREGVGSDPAAGAV